MRFRFSFVLACAVLSISTAAFAADASPAKAKGLGDPGKLAAIEFEGLGDDGVSLAGRDAFRQLVVTGKYASGQERDLTGIVKYTSQPTGICEVSSSGLVTPLKEGKANLKAEAKGGVKAECVVVVSRQVNDVLVHFTNQVVPVFTKFGCNAGGCHGKAEGQNGFKLSLLGFEPDEDHERLVAEARGRRLNFAAPDRSLLLVKAIGRMPHGGGQRLEEKSPYYTLLRRWVEQGAPVGGKDDPVVTRIQVVPHERLIDLSSRQQLAVLAHFSDGSVRDITRMAQFETNEHDLAEVAISGLVTTKKQAGVAAIMVRYQSHVDVFRATVPLGIEVANLPPARNFIDEAVFAQLKKLGLPPSSLADDATFLRRATIDIAGRLPTAKEAEEFLADTRDDKHDRLIDRLLDSEDYAIYFANKWSSVLRNRRSSPNDNPEPTKAFHGWIREQLEKNKPFDDLMRSVVTATGQGVKNPPVIWYREVKDSAAQLEDVAQLFLGQRIQCAKCHHHPFEKWSQQDYYGMAAFFSRVEVRDPPPPKKDKKEKDKDKPEPVAEPFSVSHKPGKAESKHPKTGDRVMPTGLGSEPLKLTDKDDPREKLADWMSEPSNPFFARTLANRYWKHFFGRGIVDPEDDMRVTNPPTNPELLDGLAKHFVDSRFDLKSLIKAICTSNVYRLSAKSNEFNADDKQNFSRFQPRRLNAEVLLDAIDTLTDSKSNFKGAPNGTRAVALPDNQADSYFLSVFGRPDGASACECERSSEASLAQALHLFNSTEVLNKVNGGRASSLAKDKRPHDERIRSLYLTALSRPPSAAETAALLEHVERKPDAQTAYADIIWALLNTKEFMFNH